MVHTRPAAVSEAADYETKADCLHLIMVSQVFSIPLLLPNLSFLGFISTEETSGTESDPEDNTKGITIKLICL